MSQTAYIREDQADIRLQVDGVFYDDGNSWYSYSGADLSANGAKTRAGGMGKEYELGGPATRGDATLEIQNSDSMVGFHPTLESKIGKGDCLVIITYLDDEGVVRPDAQHRVTGKLKKAALPQQVTNSPNAGMYQVVVALDEEAA